MKRRIAFCLVAVSVFALAACGGEEKAQQPEQQGAQPSPPPAQSSNRDAGALVGTWEAMETNENPGLGGGLLTFSNDGTFRAQPLPDDSPEMVLSGRYSADGSRITFIDDEGGETQTEYTLEGDTLTTRTVVEDPEFPIDQTTTYKRQS